MADASSRILVDRSVVRLNGRPFFSFGPRVLLTPQEKFPAVLQQIATSGFTVVGSPPCSPGTLPLIDAFFDAAEEADLLVVLIADPRLPEHGRYMADRFRRRSGLHSYVLPARPATDEGYRSWIRDRDAIRAQDLFHPIWCQMSVEHQEEEWFKSQDIYCPRILGFSTKGRFVTPKVGEKALRLQQRAASSPARPLFAVDLSTFTTTEERLSGAYESDDWVRRLSPRPLDWFPYMANFPNLPRKDFFTPVPEMVRLQCYDMLTAGARGIILDFFEGMTGPPPFTGRDRYAEAELLAQEISIFQDFFAEGHREPMELETGHPRLVGTVLRHGHDLLIVLRMRDYEDDYFIDEAFMERTEVTVNLNIGEDYNIWRMDFPAARQLETVRDASGAMRFLPGSMELTGLIMMTKGTKRSQELARQIQEKLPAAARAAVESLNAKFSKIALIEGELRQLDAGINNRDRMLSAQKGLEEARAFLANEDFVDAFNKARQTGRLLRMVIKYQMARALATPVMEQTNERNKLRSNYFTLPEFYEQATSDTAKAFSDLT